MITAQQELKTIAVRHRWAYEELVFDCKLIEHNQLDTDVKMWCRIKGAYGGRWAGLKALRRRLRANGTVCSKLPDRHLTTQKAEIHRLRKTEMWVFEEESRDLLIAEAKALFEKVGTMYAYLLESYGSIEAVLKALRWIVHTQGQRRKTLCVER